MYLKGVGNIPIETLEKLHSMRHFGRALLFTRDLMKHVTERFCKFELHDLQLDINDFNIDFIAEYFESPFKSCEGEFVLELMRNFEEGFPVDSEYAKMVHQIEMKFESIRGERFSVEHFLEYLAVSLLRCCDSLMSGNLETVDFITNEIVKLLTTLQSHLHSEDAVFTEMEKQCVYSLKQRVYSMKQEVRELQGTVDYLIKNCLSEYSPDYQPFSQPQTSEDSA